MAEDEGDVLSRAEVSDPVPGKHALYSNDDVLTEGGKEAEKSFWLGVDVLVKAYFAFGIKDTEVHFLSVKVDTAIILVLHGIEFHMASSFGLKCFLVQEAF
jgi:hypothetical protein